MCVCVCVCVCMCSILMMINNNQECTLNHKTHVRVHCPESACVI